MSVEDVLSRARRLHEDKRLGEASALYREILAADPAHVDALTLLGLAEAEQGRLDEARQLLAAALERAPNEGRTHFQLGQIHQGLDRLEDALASFDRAIALLPGQPEIQTRRATILRALDRPLEAITGYEAALLLDRTKPAAWYGRGMALTTLGRFDEALPDFERAVSLDPRQSAGQFNLGAAYERAGRREQAADHYLAIAAQFRADRSYHTRALKAAARVLIDLERYGEAEACLRQCLLADPTQERALQDLTLARQSACSWPVVLPFGPVTREAFVKAMDPMQIASYSDDPGLQLALNARFAIKAGAGGGEPWPSPPAAPEKRRLRIGYLSADYRSHPTPHLMYDVFGLHDRDRFEVYGYYTGPRNNDALYWHVREQCDVFVELADLDDAAAGRRIAEDGIDILIDLNGHTLHARLGIFARRPAPIIVNWLGYPGTTGSPDHHYILADDWVIPPENEPFYSETVLRLPCYQPNPRQRTASETVMKRSDFGLPENGFVFCCFNNSWKITPESFGRWMAILRDVKDSVLWLLAPPSARDALRAHAVASGVDGARLIFTERMANADHLARYALADLFLDTAPYGAHTTCSDALWMGVPVVTWSGRSFASRVCGSLVRSAGLPDLVFTDPDSFIREAVAIAKSPERLQASRARLAAERDRCVLFDIEGHVRRLEALYEEMWGAHLAGALPRPDLKLLQMDLSVREAMNRAPAI